MDGGSGRSDGGSDASIQPTFFVDAVDGDDAGDGTTQENAFRTITHALGQSEVGDLVQVAPGAHDAALGETFPIAVPAGVTVRGDPASKGAGIVIAGSAGGNVIACNVFRDLETYIAGSVTIPAAGNAWDHVPPSVSDIENPNGASIILSGATLAADPCP